MRLAHGGSKGGAAIDLRGVVIGAFVMLTLVVLVCIIVLSHLQPPASPASAAALDAALGGLISGLIAYVHSLAGVPAAEKAVAPAAATQEPPSAP
jgi:hypothetical protein